MKNRPPYPIYLDLLGMPCLVVGGGRVAERKVRSLLGAGAKVKLVSPLTTKGIQALAEKGKIQWVRSPYRKKHVGDARLVIGATGDRSVNKAIYEHAEQRKILVNIVDDPEYCRFIVPATIQRRDIQIAITTGGGAPGVSAKLRKELEQVVGEEYGVLVAELKRQRKRIRALAPEAKKTFWEKIAGLSVKKYKGKNEALVGVVGKWLA